MSGPNQANASNAMILRRRPIDEQAAHLKGCGGCLRAIPPTLGEIVDYYPPKDLPKGQIGWLSTHFVVFLGLKLADGGSSLEAQAESQYMCCVITKNPPKLAKNEPKVYYFSFRRGHQPRSDTNVDITFIPAASPYQWEWVAKTQVPAFAQPFPLNLLHRVLDGPMEHVRFRLDDDSTRKLISKITRLQIPQQIDLKEYREVEASLCNDE